MEQQIIMNKSRAGRPSEQKVLSMIEEYEESGFSPEDYCEMNELNISTFNGWLARHREKKEAKPFTEVIIPDLSEGTLFAEYKGLKFYQWVEPSFLKELVS